MRTPAAILTVLAAASCLSTASAAPANVFLTVTNMTSLVYHVDVRQAGDAHVFTLGTGIQFKHVTLKGENASISVTGPSCSKSQSVPVTNTVKIEIHKDCRLVTSSTINGF